MAVERASTNPAKEDAIALLALYNDDGDDMLTEEEAAKPAEAEEEEEKQEAQDEAPHSKEKDESPQEHLRASTSTDYLGTGIVDPLADLLLPPPPKKCPASLQKKTSKHLNFNHELRKSKGYRNPSFMERVIEYMEIDEIGSYFDKSIFDPHGYHPEDFYDALGLEFTHQQVKRQRVDSVASVNTILSRQPTRKQRLIL